MVALVGLSLAQPQRAWTLKSCAGVGRSIGAPVVGVASQQSDCGWVWAGHGAVEMAGGHCGRRELHGLVSNRGNWWRLLWDSNLKRMRTIANASNMEYTSSHEVATS